MSRRSLRLFSTALALWALPATALEKPAITYKAPPSGEEDRPVAVAITVGPQGTDYAFRIDFDKAPWGEECRTRCANATIFLDTDNNKGTGLKLSDKAAAQTGADLAITVQGTRDFKGTSSETNLRVKVKQYPEDATSVDQGRVLAELNQRENEDRLTANGNSVYLLVDANAGDLPAGPKMRVIYQPPDSKPLVGTAKGLNAPGASRVDVFKDGKLTNPVKKKPKDY